MKNELLCTPPVAPLLNPYIGVRFTDVDTQENTYIDLRVNAESLQWQGDDNGLAIPVVVLGTQEPPQIMLKGGHSYGIYYYYDIQNIKAFFNYYSYRVYPYSTELQGPDISSSNYEVVCRVKFGFIGYGDSSEEGMNPPIEPPALKSALDRISAPDLVAYDNDVYDAVASPVPQLFKGTFPLFAYTNNGTDFFDLIQRNYELTIVAE